VFFYYGACTTYSLKLPIAPGSTYGIAAMNLLKSGFGC